LLEPQWGQFIERRAGVVELTRVIVPEFPADGQILYSVLTLLVIAIALRDWVVVFPRNARDEQFDHGEKSWEKTI
jgi:hypothetical protein